MVVVADEVFDVMASHVLYTDAGQSKTHANNTTNIQGHDTEREAGRTESGRRRFVPCSRRV